MKNLFAAEDFAGRAEILSEKSFLLSVFVSAHKVGVEALFTMEKSVQHCVIISAAHCAFDFNTLELLLASVPLVFLPCGCHDFALDFTYEFVKRDCIAPVAASVETGPGS